MLYEPWFNLISGAKMTDPDSSQKERRFASTRVHGNKWGFRGVEWDGARRQFRARIEATPGKRGRWLGRYLTAEAAARAYDDAAREEYGSDAYLNFPGPGERPVKQSLLQEGLCPVGHSLSEFGRVNSKGRLYCKKCNLDAAHRYQARKREAHNV